MFSTRSTTSDVPLKVLKIYPVDMLSFEIVQGMANTFPGITFCPTGTVPLETLPKWKKMPCIGAVMTSRIVPATIVKSG